MFNLKVTWHFVLRGLLGACLSIVPLFAASEAAVPAPAETAQGPHALVEATSNELLALIERARGYAEDDEERFYEELTELLEPVVDFRIFARGVMSKKYYESATPEQFKRFAGGFKRSLVRTYAKLLLRFEGAELAVIPDRGDRPLGKRASVKMEVRPGNGEVYPVLYRMYRARDGQWRMYNIVVSGIDVRVTYMNQFVDLAADTRYGGDLDKVITAWEGVVAKQDDAEGGEGSSSSGDSA